MQLGIQDQRQSKKGDVKNECIRTKERKTSFDSKRDLYVNCRKFLNILENIL